MTRFILTLLLAAACTPALAQESNRDSAGPPSVTGPVEPADPVVRNARELDRLFGNLRSADSRSAEAITGKILSGFERNPSPTAELLLRQAGVAMSDGALDTSETMLNTLVGSYPEYAEALNRRATLYFKMGRYEESLTDIAQVLDMEPRHFGALAGRGMIHAAQGRIVEARQALEEALAINPHLDAVRAALKQLAHDNPEI